MWHKQIADDNRILLTEVGSGLHGVTINGTDDHDEMGICIPTPDTVIGSALFEQYQDRWHADGTRIPEGQRSGPRDTDHTTYALEKWSRLAAQGNPTVLMPLFAPERSVLQITPLGEYLRARKDLFLSKQAGFRFHGYLKAQRERMLGLRGRKHTNRPELVARFGFDTKCAYHALRLAFQGIQLMTNHSIHLPMVEHHVELLRDIREGYYPLHVVIKLLDRYTATLMQTVSESSLPNSPDLEELNCWLIGMHYTHWKKKGIL